ncbi:MAG TPA: hypothetical protein VIB07_08625 [Nitrososphaera sp.]|jgi:hypothetical protein
MKQKARVKRGKRRMAASKLKTKNRKKVSRKAGASRKKGSSARKSAGPSGKRIVRIMGQGQFTVDSKMLKKLNDIDNAIVDMVSRERSDDAEFKRKLTELSEIVVKKGKPLDPKAIIQSDIILPSADLSVDEAKKLFRGEGVIPEL